MADVGFIKLPRTTLRELGKGSKLLAYIEIIDRADFKAKRFTMTIRNVADDFGFSRSVSHRVFQRAAIDLGWDKVVTNLGQGNQAEQGLADDSRDKVVTNLGHTIIEDRRYPSLPPTERSKIPPGIDPELWEAFRNGRAQNKKKMTEVAESRMLKRLATFQSQGHDPNAMLDQSIRTGWADVFPVKADHLQSQPHNLESL